MAFQLGEMHTNADIATAVTDIFWLSIAGKVTILLDHVLQMCHGHSARGNAERKYPNANVVVSFE